MQFKLLKKQFEGCRFHCDGIFKFMPKWDKCINVVKEYDEK
jgi:hypothetical protein